MGNHIVLLGDSIFDNASYVPGNLPVIEQVRQRLPLGDEATLLAVDGNVTADVMAQLSALPPQTTHLFVSAGGNDALGNSHLLDAPQESVIAGLTGAYLGFREEYRRMLDAVGACQKPTAVCTIYDSVPGLETAAVMALSLFNDIVLREAFARNFPVIDLRSVCAAPEDYSELSPIEPSAVGGAKIADRIVDVLRHHDFSAPRSTVYT